MSWVFKRTEPGQWTSGYYDPDGHWEPQADHGSAKEAAEHVAYLNGGGFTWAALTAEAQQQLADAVAERLQQRAATAQPAPVVLADELTAPREVYIASLRSLADWLASNPGIPVPKYPDVTVHASGASDADEQLEVDQAAAAMGVTPIWNGTRTHYKAETRVGSIEFTVLAISQQYMADRAAARAAATEAGL